MDNDAKRRTKNNLVEYFSGKPAPEEQAPMRIAQANPRAISYEDAYNQVPHMDKPAFAGTKNMLKGKENANFNAVQQDVDDREALLNQPARAPASQTIPSPYMQPKPMMPPSVENGMPMDKPAIQTQELPSPSMNANPPLDNEDLKALGLIK